MVCDLCSLQCFAAASTPSQEVKMSKTDFTDAFTSTRLHRRNFIKTAGAGAAGAALIGTGFSSLSPTVAQAQTAATLSKYTEQLAVPAVINAKGGGTFSLP